MPGFEACVPSCEGWLRRAVSVYFDGSNVHFSFGIPRGADGEVTVQQLTAAIAGTSTNSDAVATMDTPFSDPDAEALRVKYNELLLTLGR